MTESEETDQWRLKFEKEVADRQNDQKEIENLTKEIASLKQLLEQSNQSVQVLSLLVSSGSNH